MDKLEVIILLASILTFAVGTILPLLKILIKVNSTIQKNTDTIDGLKSTMHEFTTTNQKDHDHFFSEINSLNMAVAVLQEKHRND